MIIPEDASIPEDKLTKYLLVSRPWMTIPGFSGRWGLNKKTPTN